MYKIECGKGIMVCVGLIHPLLPGNYGNYLVDRNAAVLESLGHIHRVRARCLPAGCYGPTLSIQRREVPVVAASIQSRECEAVQLALAGKHDQLGDPLEVCEVEDYLVRRRRELAGFAVKAPRIVGSNSVPA